jgi:hypothetical protein
MALPTADYKTDTKPYNALASAFFGIGDAFAGTNNQASYMKLKQDAVEWQQAQKQKAFEQQLSMQEKGYQPIAEFPGGNPEDFTAITTPQGDGYFKPVADEKLKSLIAKGKASAIESLTPEQKTQFFLNGGRLPKGPSKPSALALEKFATSQAMTEAGGSFMTGVSENAQKKFVALKKEKYQELLKRYGVQDGAGEVNSSTDPEANIDYTQSNF